MRKADLVASISDKTGVPKVDVLVSLETFFKEVKSSIFFNPFYLEIKFYLVIIKQLLSSIFLLQSNINWTILLFNLLNLK